MANSQAIKRSGIVLRKTEVKEADAMVLCLDEGGLFSFYARGVRKLTSKNAASIGEMTLSDFVLLESSGGSLTLKEGAPIKSFLRPDDLNASLIEGFLCELTSRLFNEEEGEGKEFYPFLKTSLEAISEGFDALTSGFLCFAKALNEVGFGLNVDECVRCGSKKNIVGVSYEDGGYVCGNCYEEGSDIKLDPLSLKILRYAFRCGEADISRVAFEKEVLLPLFAQLAEYLYDATSLRIKNLDFLLKIL